MSENTDKIVEEIKDVVREGGVSSIIITNKEGEVKLNVPLTVGAIGVTVGLFTIPWITIGTVIATVGLGCGIEVKKSDGQIIKIR